MLGVKGAHSFWGRLTDLYTSGLPSQTSTNIGLWSIVLKIDNGILDNKCLGDNRELVDCGNAIQCTIVFEQ